jgi:large conductance mechanosensitive channel
MRLRRQGEPPNPQRRIDPHSLFGTVRARGDDDAAREPEDWPVADVFKEFKEFISRGNVVDLAVAVVIGAAFTAIVTSVVEGLITPLIGMIGGKDFRQMTFTVNNSVFSYGIVINAVIYFVSVSAVVFFLVVKPLNVLQERRRRGQEPPPEELSDEAALLTEIRDLLRAQSAGAGSTARPASPPVRGPSDDPPSPTGW